MTSGLPMALEQLPQVSLQQIVRHPEAAVRDRAVLCSRKKQYLQSRLQIAPVGFARIWNAGGAFRGMVSPLGSLAGELLGLFIVHTPF